MLKRFPLEHGPSKGSRTTTIRPPRFRRETASCREAGRLRKYIWAPPLFSVKNGATIDGEQHVTRFVFAFASGAGRGASCRVRGLEQTERAPQLWPANSVTRRSETLSVIRPVIVGSTLATTILLRFLLILSYLELVVRFFPPSILKGTKLYGGESFFERSSRRAIIGAAEIGGKIYGRD